MSKALCPVCRKPVLVKHSHVTVHDLEVREIYHGRCFVGSMYAKVLASRIAEQEATK